MEKKIDLHFHDQNFTPRKFAKNLAEKNSTSYGKDATTKEINGEIEEEPLVEQYGSSILYARTNSLLNTVIA